MRIGEIACPICASGSRQPHGCISRPENPDPPLRLHDNKPIYNREKYKEYKRRKSFNDPDMVKSVADAISGRRLELGWSTEELARKAGILSPSINRIETGSIDGLHYDVVLRVVKALGLYIVLVWE